MIIKNIDLESLSRDEYIDLILLIICSFKLNYEYFDTIEKIIIEIFIEEKWDKIEVKNDK